jgi:hypothetical protein
MCACWPWRVARIGAVPVMLSPALDGATVGALLGRMGQPYLLTDGLKLDALADVPVADLTRKVISVAGSRQGSVSLTELAGSPADNQRNRRADLLNSVH